MSKLFIVGIGGFIGAVLRYLMSGYVQNLTRSSTFPIGTIAVNITGCFLIGMVSQLVASQANLTGEIRLLVMVGLLGAFTTYSTFSYETMNLLQDQKIFLALLNIGVHLILGLAAVLLGRLTITVIWR